MNTLEERATKYANGVCARYGECGIENEGWRIAYNQYICICQQQKEVDDTRYEFFKEKLINQFASWVNDNWKQPIFISMKDWLQHFREFAEQ